MSGLSSATDVGFSIAESKELPESVMEHIWELWGLLQTW